MHPSISLPHGRGDLTIRVPEKNLIGVIEPRDLPGVPDPLKEVERALKNPIESPKLESIAKPGDKVAIVITDVTRRCPDHIIVPAVIRELKKAGVRLKDITVVTALGIHRPMTEEEIKSKMGEAYGLVRAINHDCYDKEKLSYLGETRRLKTPVWINKLVVESDVIITTGVVEAHTIAGYSGGRKSIMPGVSGKETIAATHRPELIDNPDVCVGKLEGNPFHEDIVEIARLVGVDFIVNVVLNSKNQIVKATAGDLVKAHEALVSIYDKMYKVQVNEVPDIVISVPAPPKDINLYQATRAGNNLVLVPKPLIKRGGTIIIPALCRDGVGDEVFYQWMKSAKDPLEVLERAKKHYRIGVHKPYILSKILQRAEIFITNSAIKDEVIREMHMIPAKDVEEALNLAFEKHGKDARVLVLTHGVVTIPVLRE